MNNRYVQIGVHISEMGLLTIGEINDMYIEGQNDEVPEAYNRILIQQDFDRFKSIFNDSVLMLYRLGTHSELFKK